MKANAPKHALAPTGLVLDSCVVLNLYASGHIEEIVRASGAPVLVTDYTIQTEVKWVGSGRLSLPDSDVEIVALGPLLARGTLGEVRVQDEREADLYLEMAALMDDGEAMAAAIAIGRNHALATDDRRARTLLSRRVPPVRVISTSQIVEHWTTRETVPPAEVRTVLNRIRRRGRFAPPASDPLFDWWIGVEQADE